MTPIDPKRPIPPPSGDDKKFYTKWKEKLGLTNDQFTIQVIVYVLLVIGLTCLLFAPFLGGIILGAIIGFAFADEIYRWVIHVKEALEHDAVLRGVILGVLCLAILIVAPGFVIGAAVAVAIKKIVHIGEDTPNVTTQTPVQTPVQTPAPTSAPSQTSTQTKVAPKTDMTAAKPEVKPETPPKTNK